MNFGVQSKRKVKVEKYPNNAVITLPGVEDKGQNRKIEFNKAARELLGFNEDDYNEVAFSFDMTDLSINKIINANEFNSGANLKVTKSHSVSNKKHYNELKSRFNVEDKEDLELEIVWKGDMFKTDKIFDLRLLTQENINTEPISETQEVANTVIS